MMEIARLKSLYPHAFEEDSDIVLADTDPESDEEITIVSVRLAPRPSGSAMEIHDEIVVSGSEPESDAADLEDRVIVVSLFYM